MGYTALYRRYRPQRWEEIVGQRSVTLTLRHALQAGKVGHAYLFAGPRGSGKTTTAKLLAKSVNCLAPTDGEPCNACLICTEINQGSSLDVLEIDAASHRGIDDVRDLQERIKYAPARAAYKVYIIDEVHMLTPEAFNALLKTLEEPPAHAIFILATTDPQKVPPTVASRCQRFFFRPLTTQEITGQLADVAARERVEITPAALAALARLAGGSIRDALSMLDQCFLYSPGVVDDQTVTEVLGVVPEAWLVEFAQALDAKEAGRVLELLHQALEEGKSANQLLADVLAWARDLLILRLCPQEAGLVTLSEAARHQMAQLANFPVPFLLKMTEVLREAQASIRWHSQPQLVLELAFFKILVTGMEAGETSLAIPDEAGSSRPGGKKRVRTPEPPVPAAQGSSRPVRDSGHGGKGAEAVREPPPTGQVTLEAVSERWPQILETARRLRVTLHAVMVEASPVDLEDDTLTLGFTPDRAFHRQRMEQKENLEAAGRAVEQVIGKKVRVRCVELPPEAGKETAAAREDPVEVAARMFEGRIVNLEQRGD